MPSSPLPWTIVLALSYLLPVTRSSLGAELSDRPVDWAQLAAAITGADRIVVHENLSKDAKLLYSSTSGEDIAAFRDAVTIVPPKDGEGFHCMCLGTPAVRLYSGEKEVVLVTNHHGQSIRTSLWTSDARLKDQESWLRWFDARGMKEPRAEVSRANEEAKTFQGWRERWNASMPESIRLLTDRSWESEWNASLEPVRAKLTEEFPDKRARVLALFNWFGSGSGAWSGFPGYEEIPEKLLLEFTTPELAEAAQAPNLTQAQLEGAARLFAGWSFSQERPKDVAKLPRSLKQTLLRHALNSPKQGTWNDDDKRERAQKAFGK